MKKVIIIDFELGKNNINVGNKDDEKKKKEMIRNRIKKLKKLKGKGLKKTPQIL